MTEIMEVWYGWRGELLHLYHVASSIQRFILNVGDGSPIVLYLGV